MTGGKNQNLYALFAAGHAVISSEIHVNFNKTGQFSPAQVCRQALQKHWMESHKELNSGVLHTWKYINALLCKWT